MRRRRTSKSTLPRYPDPPKGSNLLPHATGLNLQLDDAIKTNQTIHAMSFSPAEQNGCAPHSAQFLHLAPFLLAKANSIEQFQTHLYHLDIAPFVRYYRSSLKRKRREQSMWKLVLSLGRGVFIAATTSLPAWTS
jgi:hypothetical protein